MNTRLEQLISLASSGRTALECAAITGYKLSTLNRMVYDYDIPILPGFWEGFNRALCPPAPGERVYHHNGGHTQPKGKDSPTHKYYIDNPEERERKRQLGRKQWDALTEEQQTTQIKNLLGTVQHSANRRSKRGFYYSQKITGGKGYYRSSWEEKLCVILDGLQEVTSFELEPFKVAFTGIDGRRRYTYPDFLINQAIVVEVKPAEHVVQEATAIKLRAAAAHCRANGMKYYVLTKVLPENVVDILQGVCHEFF